MKKEIDLNILCLISHYISLIFKVFSTCLKVFLYLSLIFLLPATKIKKIDKIKINIFNLGLSKTKNIISSTDNIILKEQ